MRQRISFFFVLLPNYLFFLLSQKKYYVLFKISTLVKNIKILVVFFVYFVFFYLFCNLNCEDYNNEIKTNN